MKKLILLSLMVACIKANDTTNTVSIPKDPALDAKAESQMPKSNNVPMSIAEMVKRPGLRGDTNGPIRLQSAQPQPIAPSFADGVRLGFIVARRNQDLADLQAVYAYAVQFWQQEQAQRQAAQQKP